MTDETQPLLGFTSSRLTWKSNTNKIKKNFLITLSLITIFGLLFTTFHLKQTTHPHHRFDTNPPAHVIPELGGPTWTPSHNTSIKATHGAVASDSKLCSDLGISILQKGGFAADAAVVTCLCIGATNTMFSSGIGGGGFITTKRFDDPIALSIDAREMAPGKAHRDMFEGVEHLAQKGGLAVAIPGELKGLYTLFEKHGSGKLSWEELVMPVADIVRDGFVVDKLLERAFLRAQESGELDPFDWKFAINGDGVTLKAGEVIKRPALAKTLTEIARNGSDAVFYDPKGRIAKSLSEKAKQYGGILTPEDFGKYQVKVEEALVVDDFTSKNLTVFVVNGASSGVSLAAGLKILNKFNDVEMKDDFGPIDSQRLIETMKWMGSVRSHLGDIGIYNDNRTAINEHNDLYDHFLSDKYANEVRNKIDDYKTLPSWRDYNPAYEPNDPKGTSSLSVIDNHGNAVSITTTVNLLFGSGVHDPETGIILNDEMDDFSLPTAKNAFDIEPSHFNYIHPYRRPLSSSSQSLVFDPEKGKVVMAIGAAGGSRITTAVLQGIVRSFYYGLDLVDTIAFPRLHHQLLPNVVYVEGPEDPDFIRGLIERGHEVETILPMSTLNAVKVVNGTFYAQSDYWRKLGRASGY
ncbi:unnamed protein product [Ambrosiozyma monospora]|uniref:Unnamed protein product n=1 Tax=Ambrosiozyma monospora TaxID=43982 RepID=A0ACB5SW32_AMBMO|nr:unnamed protein product [Ambrosiozyma monospora]